MSKKDSNGIRIINRCTYVANAGKSNKRWNMTCNLSVCNKSKDYLGKCNQNKETLYKVNFERTLNQALNHELTLENNKIYRI